MPDGMRQQFQRGDRVTLDGSSFVYHVLHAASRGVDEDGFDDIEPGWWFVRAIGDDHGFDAEDATMTLLDESTPVCGSCGDIGCLWHGEEAS